MTDTAAPPLSHSSAMTLLGCEQKYVFYKVEKLPADPDYAKSDALGLGSAFHWILEKSRHEKPKSITADLEVCVRDPAIGLAAEDVPLVHAMVLKYLRLHAKMNLKVLAVEVEIRTESTHGFIDAVMEDEDGNWTLMDLKTWKTLNDGTLRQLQRDPQMNLYAANKDVVAEMLGLLPEKFAGVRWRVCTKSTAKLKANELYVDYLKRLVDKHLTAYDIFVPASSLASQERLDLHHRLWERSQVLRAHGAKPIKNFGHCFSYFASCEYFSRCHGATFSEIQMPEILED